MFAFAQQANKVSSSSLCVNYDVERIVSGALTYYTVTRNAQYDYEYQDLTEGGAIDSASSKLKKYTRAYGVLGPVGSDGVPTNVTVTSCLSEITPIRAAGSSWTLSVKVIERDIKATTTTPTSASIEAMFATENARDYDAVEPGVLITAAEKTASYLRLSVTMTGGVTASSLILRYEHGGSWECVDGGVWNGSTVTFSSATTTYADAEKMVASFGPISSNIVNIGG